MSQNTACSLKKVIIYWYVGLQTHRVGKGAVRLMLVTPCCIYKLGVYTNIMQTWGTISQATHKTASTIQPTFQTMCVFQITGKGQGWQKKKQNENCKNAHAWSAAFTNYVMGSSKRETYVKQVKSFGIKYSYSRILWLTTISRVDKCYTEISLHIPPASKTRILKF
jgi:hypothetical protein